MIKQNGFLENRLFFTQSRLVPIQIHGLSEFKRKMLAFKVASLCVCVGGGGGRVVVMVVCWWVCGCVNEVCMEVTGCGNGCVRVGRCLGVWVGG